MPRTPPTSRDVFVIAEPSPARSRPTLFITAAVIGAIVAPMPWPMARKIGNISQYDVVGVSNRPSRMSPPPARHSP